MRLLSWSALILIFSGNWACGQEAELKRFQGDWQAVFLQNSDGEVLEKDVVQKTTLTISKNKFALKSKKTTINGTFKLHRDKKKIDAFLKTAGGKKIMLLGIYRWEKGRRRSCFALPEQPRPAEFSKEKGFLTFVWERPKRK